MDNMQYWLPEGTVLSSRYVLKRMIGSGGYGITYEGEDSHLRRRVAIKEYFPKFWASRFAKRSLAPACQRERMEAYRKGILRFQEEAFALAQLSVVREVVQVSDFFEENNTAYLVMEYLEGKDLKHILDGFGGRIPGEILIPAMEPLVRALGKIHGMGLIHRDISPDNIMLLEDGTVRLIDFGNARDTTEDRSMTLAMKEGFAPPEQYSSHGQGTFTDVYSLCATMYYCLSGRLPTKPFERLTGAPFPSLTELGVAIPSQWEQAILDGLELYVAKRIQTMEILAERLYSVPSEPTPELPAEPSTEVSQASHPRDMESVKKFLQIGLREVRSVLIQAYQKVKER